MIKSLRNSIPYIAFTLLLGVASNYLYDYVKQIPVLGFIVHLINKLTGWIMQVLQFEISLWIILLILFFFGILRSILKSIRQNTDPEFTKYKRDQFRNWIWRWDWKPSTSGWQLVNMQPFCPTCDVRLVESSYGYPMNYKCPKCQRAYRDDEPENEIKSLIFSKIDKKEF